MEPMGLCARRVARFVRQRTLLWLLIPPFLCVGVIIHELVHVAMVLAQGGHVIEVSFLPALGEDTVSFGRTVHSVVGHQALVSVAPALVWTILAVTTLLLLPRVRRARVAELLLLALVILPMVDISLAFASLFLGQRGADLAVALAGQPSAAGLLMAVMLPGLGVLAWMRFRALRPGALSAAEFGAGLTAMLVVPWLIVALV